MAVQTQPGFQAQAVPRAKTDGGHLGHGQKRLGKGPDMRVGNGQLEPVLAGIARPGHPDVLPLPDLRRHIQKAHRSHTRQKPHQGRFGQRPLQGQQGAVRHLDHFSRRRQMGAHMGKIGGLAGGVDDDKKMGLAVGEHQVIQDAALRFREQAIALPPGFQARHIGGHQRLEGKGKPVHPGLRPQHDLSHMADIKQPCGGAGVQVFLHDPGTVLDRHLIARKGNQTRAQRQVQVLQGQMFQRCLFGHASPLGRRDPASLACPAPGPGMPTFVPCAEAWPERLLPPRRHGLLHLTCLG